jgi:predicted nucleic acid-binding protein
LSFINEEIIPEKIWLASEKTTKNIDINDTDFVALASFLKATLWTGDKILYNGLKKNKFKHIVNTAELIRMRTIKKTK